MTEPLPLISIVVPAFNEEESAGPFYNAVTQVIVGLEDRYRFEFVFVDDGSSDKTFPVLKNLAAQDKRVRVIRFSRNFGFQQAVSVGFCKARGDAAIELDCDLQDPPELIGEFVRLWKEEGWQVVYGVRRKRQESPLMAQMRHWAYWIINRLSEDPIPLDSGDFRLVDRRILDELRQMQDVQPYLRGAIAAMGFRQTGVPYDRPSRALGQSKFPLSKLIQLALDGILNHSVIPLRLATYLGFFLSFFTFFGFLAYFFMRLLFGQNWPLGFATTTTLQLFSLSINCLFLGVIGEYLGRIYRQVKRPPKGIVAEEVGGDDSDPSTE